MRYPVLKPFIRKETAFLSGTPNFFGPSYFEAALYLKCSIALAYFVQSHTKEIACHCEKKWTFLALFFFLPATASKLSPYFVGQNIILLTKWLFTKKKVSQTTVILPYFFQLFCAPYFCCCVTSLYLQKYKHN